MSETYKYFFNRNPMNMGKTLNRFVMTGVLMVMILFLFLIFGFIMTAQAQTQNMGIGTTTPHPSAALDVDYTNKGVLIPRLTTTQRNAITSPAMGLLIFNVEDSCFHYYSGIQWIPLCGGTTGGPGTFCGLVANAGDDVETCPGLIVPIGGMPTAWGGTPPFTYSWSPGTGLSSTNVARPSAYPDSTTTYILTVTDSNGCTHTDKIAVGVAYWTQKANLPAIATEQRLYATGAAIPGKGYVGTGLRNSTNSFLGDWWEYNPVADSWTQKTDLPDAGRYGAMSFEIGGKIFICCGYGSGGSYYNSVWEYDPAGNNWTQKNNFAGTGRMSGVVFAVAGKGYLAGGMDADSSRTDFWQYDPATDTWLQMGYYPGGETYRTIAASLNNLGYILSSNNGGGGTVNYRFDPSNNQWTQIANGATGANVAFVIGNNIYAANMSSTGPSGVPIEKYDPATNQWSLVCKFSGPNRWAPVGFAVNGKGYITCGLQSSGTFDDLWEYTPY